MSQILNFQIRRGTEAQLSGITLANGELGWCEDSKRVYCGDGAANYLVGRVQYGDGAPAGNGVAGTIYIDTSASGIYLSAGSGWMHIGGADLAAFGGTLDTIADGTTYNKVLASEITNGAVKQINDGTYTVSASTAYGHINDSTIHRQINDGVLSTTSLWSSQKINDQLTAVVHGIDWQDSVKSLSIGTPPSSPTNGDRYIIPASGIGIWSSHLLSVTQYMTASGGWVYYPPNEGFASWVEDEDRVYVYTGSVWTKMSSVTVHNELSGLQGGAAGEYYHLSGTDYAALVTNRTETVQDIVGNFVTASGHITVSYDDNGNILVIGMTQIAHSELSGIGANDHHNQVHLLTGTDHTVTGLTTGQIMKATGATSFGFSNTVDCGTFA